MPSNLDASIILISFTTFIISSNGLDFLIMNEDRHLNNFGIIRDVNTLKWLDMAPIFDNGQSLNIQDYNDEEVVISGHGRLFYEALYLLL